MSVAVFHFSAALPSEVARFIGTFAWLGVDVFFVISGFVIPLSLHDRGYRPSHYPNFLLRRLLRLEPPYLVSIAMVILLEYLSSLAPGFRYRFEGDSPIGGERSQPASMRQWWARMDRLFPGFSFEVRDVVVSGPPWRMRIYTQLDFRKPMPDGTPYTNVVGATITTPAAGIAQWVDNGTLTGGVAPLSLPAGKRHYRIQAE